MNRAAQPIIFVLVAMSVVVNFFAFSDAIELNHFAFYSLVAFLCVAVAFLILSFIYMLTLSCVFEHKRITVNSIFKNYIMNIDDVDSISISHDGSMYNYTPDHEIESTETLRHAVYIVFAKKGCFIKKDISCIYPASDEFVAVEYRASIRPIVDEYYNYLKETAKHK